MKSEKTKFREKEIQKKTSENFRKKRKRKSEKVSEYRKVPAAICLWQRKIRHRLYFPTIPPKTERKIGL